MKHRYIVVPLYIGCDAHDQLLVEITKLLHLIDCHHTQVPVYLFFFFFRVILFSDDAIAQQ